MFSTKSPIVKYVGYAIIGFFGLIIVISFGMPDFLSRLGSDKSVVAIVNGQKLHIIDFVRYRNQRFRAFQNQKEMQNYILDSFIQENLIQQYARKSGFTSTEERIVTEIRNIPQFKNPETGDFDPNRVASFRQHYKMSFKDLEKLIKNDLIKRSFFDHLRMAAATTENEVKSIAAAESTRISIQYAFLTDSALKKILTTKIKVTDAEIDAEMAKSAESLKDPETDRKRIKIKIENQKLSQLKEDIIKKINSGADKGMSFAVARNILKGTVGTTKAFSPGDPLIDAKNSKKRLDEILASEIFLRECLSLKPGQSSHVIRTDEGLYLFTPASISKNAEKDKKQIANQLKYKGLNMIMSNLSRYLFETSKITKNLEN